MVIDVVFFVSRQCLQTHLAFDSMRYGTRYGAMASLCGKGGKGALPPASYRLAYTASAEAALVPPTRGSRGVYSFCMCPGERSRSQLLLS